MAVSKVVLGDETLIDLTGDSVSSENLLQGATAHAANGEQITGGVVVTPMYTGTKAAIEEAIALGQIPEDAVVNITDDEETSSFQTQINEINSSLGDITGFTNSAYDSIGDFIQYCVDNGYLPDINRLPLIPIMTSNNTPSGEASASSYDQSSTNYYPYRAFEDTDGTVWFSTGTTNQWIQYKFVSAQKVKELEITPVKDDATRIKDFILQGSNDGSSYVNIFSGTVADNGNKQTFKFTNNNAYLYYRLYIGNSYSSSKTIGVKRIQMY